MPSPALYLRDQEPLSDGRTCLRLSAEPPGRNLAETMLDNAILKDVASEKWYRPQPCGRSSHTRSWTTAGASSGRAVHFKSMGRATPSKVRYECQDCGLLLHDADAIRCKHCGRVQHIHTEGLV